MLLSLTLLLAAVVDEPTVTLAGRVVDAAGAPLAGAEVMLTGLQGPDGLPVVTSGKADDAGRFALQRPGGLAGRGGWGAPRLWAYRAGHRLASVAFPGPLPAAGEEVRVTLPAGAGAEYRVEGPDGRPVVGARVRVRSLAPFFTPPPEGLAERLEAQTDADGRATIAAIGGEQVAEVGVEADGFGLQPRFFDPPLPGSRRLALRPPSSLEGRFVAPDGRPLRGWKVSATTLVREGTQGRTGPSGRVEPIPLAEDGRFKFPAIAAGDLDLRVDWPDDPVPDVLPSWPQRLAVVEGRVNRVEIPLRPAAEVSGVIRERGTGKPVPGVMVSLFGAGQSGGSPRTDAEGRWRTRCLPGKMRAHLSDVPPAYINPPAAFRDEFEVPPPPGRVALPPVELGRAAPPLKGVVRDATGAPVAGATVGGQWYATFEAGGAIQAGIQAATDNLGRFEVVHIAPDAKVTLTAQKGALATAAPVEARGGQAGAVTLTVQAGRTVAVAGRVVDTSGRPLASAAVRFNAEERPKGVNSQNWRQLSFDSGNWLYTKADGTFETPRQTRAEGLEFQAEAVANGYVMVQTPWTPVGDGDVLRLPDIALRREAGARVVVGRVVDSKGAPIAGARVLQRGDGPQPTEALADADGRFRLPGVAGGRALVCARARGFRDGGAIAGPEGSVEIRLARAGEAARPLGRAPEPLTRAEERKLGLSLLGPVRRPEKAAALEAAAHRGEAGPLFARLDPDRAVEMLEDRALQNPTGSLIQIAMARFEDDPAAALAILDADRSGLARARGLCPLADLADAIAPSRRAEILDRAAAEARRLESAEEKLILLGEVADRWLESFDLDRAAPVLREGQKVLTAAKPELFAFHAAPFGEALAAIDLPAAEAFLARKPGGSKGAEIDMRDRAALAVRLAVADPKAAERQARMLKQVPNFYDPQAYLLRIARNMARADLPRARAVLDLLDDPKARINLGKGPLKPYGLALLAEARAEVDPEGARALLDEAFAGLRALAEAQPGQVSYPSIDEVMVGLLPLVERLRPDRMAERLWLAVACRANRTEPLEGHRAADMLVLALLVSRYDREMAAVIAEPVTAALPELASQSNGGGMPFYRSPGNPFHVLAAYDPRALVAFIERLPESARVTRDKGQGPTLSVEDRARWAGAEMLGMPPEARRRAAVEGPFDAWPVRGHMRYRRVLQ